MKPDMEKTIYIIVLIFFIQNVYSQLNNNQCSTPETFRGVCINIKNCPKLKVLLETQRSNATVVAFLRKSMCGYDGKDPKVCCRLNDKNTNTPQPLVSQPSTVKLVSLGSSGYETVKSPKLPSQKMCGRTNSTHIRVIGGQPSELGDWPWMTALGYRHRSSSTNSSYIWLCGGALLSDRYVLTAAHCTVGLGSLVLTIARFGELDLNPNVDDGADPIDVPISRVIRHEQYSAQTYVNDIALLKLETSVRFNHLIQPICLPIYSDIRAHKLLKLQPFISGWGATAYKGPSSTHLMEIQFPVLDNEVCKTAFAKINRNAVIDDRIICAGHLKGGKDSCQGDSGGPLMLPSGTQYYLVGIVSYGYKCAEAGFPGIYTRTTSFLDWIMQNINKS